jgi:hypothetical protein
VARVRTVRRVLALVCGGLFAACHHAAGGTASEARAPVAVDSIEGTVQVVGVDAFPEVSLALDDGRPALTLVGPASLRRLAGLRVRVIGDRSGTRLTVRRFTVLAANNVAATDGMLASDGDAVILVTPDGARHRLVSPPPLFRSNIGHRVWVSGPLDQAPVAYGLIE